MVRLTLNNLPAVIKAGFSIKLTQTNPYLTEAGSFTLDVTLPLKGCAENQRIFGAIHRPEMSLAHLVGTRYEMRLLAAPMVMDGYATVTSVSEMEVKVQLIAESSNLKAEREIANGQNIYIDKLDLGTLPSQRSFEVAGDNGYLCSFFPVYSEADSCIVNKTMAYIGLTGNIQYRHFTNVEVGDEAYTIAPQPYLYMVIEKVLEALGYTVRTNTIRSNWMSRIFIANAHADTVLAHLLPHWTVDEFLEEVRNFFGVYIIVEGKNVDIIGRNEAYAGDGMVIIDIKEVLDEHESDMNEDEEQKDISTANVAYDCEYDQMLCLPDEVWENAIVKTFPNETQLAQWSSSTDADKTKSEYLMVNREDGNCYAWLKNLQTGAFELSRVNCMPPLIRENPYDANTRRDIDIKLRIVPVRMTPQLIPHKQEWITDGLKWNTFYKEEWVYVPMMTTSQATGAIYQDYSINAAINPDSEDSEHEVTEKLDVIEVGYNPLASWQAAFKNKDDVTTYCDIRTAFGVSVWKLEDGAYWNIIMPGNNEQFRLTQNIVPSIRKTAMETDYDIDTRCQHMISFLDGGIFPVKAVYNIKGKRYVCMKIEYTINERGLAPLKRGYFYELN